MQENLDTRGLIKKINIIGYAIIFVLIVIADEIVKFTALKILPDEGSLVDPAFFSLAIHKNFGIAFDIPFKMWVIVLISLVIGFFLIQIIIRNWGNRPKVSLMAMIIIIGAAGNMYDRLVYGFTVDYIMFFSRLAINFSDVVILVGVAGLLILTQRKQLKSGEDDI
ncbi:signal peptidase II [Patescibacteria group bacterium]|nr:signal peptidase II [Patescibacteria group bacterium]